MRIKKPDRSCTITITVTEAEKMAITAQAERENRTIGGYIRYRLQDVLRASVNEGGAR